ncbi:hypothetical protein SEA_BOBBY_180 [Mycobacterium phage Bobby]|nr:hypothetical protein SEA_BOBBY_180 [Mycobacterium phage Bobby]
MMAKRCPSCGEPYWQCLNRRAACPLLHAAMVEAGKPRCSECNRVVHVGAATNNKWLCEYCQIIADFKGA